jgi:hypothetical protein
MAVSLAFGVLFATIVTLYLIPCSLIVAEDLRRSAIWLRDWYFRPFRNVDLAANPATMAEQEEPKLVAEGRGV